MGATWRGEEFAFLPREDPAWAQIAQAVADARAAGDDTIRIEGYRIDPSAPSERIPWSIEIELTDDLEEFRSAYWRAIRDHAIGRPDGHDGYGGIVAVTSVG